MWKYEFHPLAKSLPLMHEPDFSEFVQDIKENGQLLPIGIFEGMILDGRNRYLACQKLGILAKTIPLSPKDAKAYVTSINVHRRQLTREQRQHHLTLLIAQQDALQMTNKEVAKAVDVSVSTVKRERRKKGSKPPVLTPSENGQTDTEPPKTSAKQSVGEGVRDDDGMPIPKNALPYWNRRPEAKNVLNQISACRGQVKKLEPTDPMWSSVNLNGVIADLNAAYNRFKAAIPAFVCPYCKGVKVDGCKCCKGKGVISEFVMSQVPEEIRNGRT